jgi:hypothetical protein
MRLGSICLREQNSVLQLLECFDYDYTDSLVHFWIISSFIIFKIDFEVLFSDSATFLQCCLFYPKCVKFSFFTTYDGMLVNHITVSPLFLIADGCMNEAGIYLSQRTKFRVATPRMV